MQKVINIDRFIVKPFISIYSRTHNKVKGVIKFRQGQLYSSGPGTLEKCRKVISVSKTSLCPPKKDKFFSVLDFFETCQTLPACGL